MTSQKTNRLPIPNQGPAKSVAQSDKEMRQLKENDFLKEAKAFFDSQKDQIRVHPEEGQCEAPSYSFMSVVKCIDCWLLQVANEETVETRDRK